MGTAWLPITAHAQDAAAQQVPQAETQPAETTQEPAETPAVDAPRVPAVPSADAATVQEPAEPPLPPLDDPQESPIISDAEFDASVPALSDDIDAPLESLESFSASTQANTPAQTNAQATTQATPESPSPTAEAGIPETLDPVPEESAEIAAPLTPLAEYDTEPTDVADSGNDGDATEIRYSFTVEGLEELGIEDSFRHLSALDEGDGRAANAAMVAARGREDERLAQRLLRSMGYYDATTTLSVRPRGTGNGANNNGSGLAVTLHADPGALYTIGSVRIVSKPTVPPDLVQRALPLAVGDPIESARVQAAEANVSITLPQQGYPFVRVLARDILLDETDHSGAYTLPVDPGSRATFGTILTIPAGPNTRLAFDAEHVGVLSRFRVGELYDSRKVDDLREALVATGLFSNVSVEPQPTGEPGPDGTEAIQLLVRQNAGPPRTLALEGGYSTGQGARLEGSWTHRNLFPPEGALILSGVVGTQEQGASVTFRRSNAGQRDRTFSVAASATHNNYTAYESFTGSLSARMAVESTPIWQKRWTHYYGFELVAANEDRYNFSAGGRDRGTWLIATLPAFLGYDTSDDLLNPTRGYRVKLNISPETSVRGAMRPYARMMVEGTGYYPVTDGLVLAGRARFGSIYGIGRDDLPPSRRYYAGGGGSVRGFGYQELGPRSPDGKPVGGLSFAEFALEARYRFGDFGIVPFIDAGQVYDNRMPQMTDIRFGAGIGGRFYTNFGPMRVDVATPINRQPGESRISLYISIGQAF